MGKLNWDALTAEAKQEAEKRRERVLRWPQAARRLCEHPLNLQRPEQWSGYIPPKYYGDKPNESPFRAALIEICMEVVALERQMHDNPAADPTAPVAPPPPSTGQLAGLHACFDRLGITDDADQLDYLQGQTGRLDLASSKELSADECAAITMGLWALVVAETQQEERNETTSQPAADQARVEPAGQPADQPQAQGPARRGRGGATAGQGDQRANTGLPAHCPSYELDDPPY